jgi:2-desacetyl-2-hydroxyethyl bacteriochlorophyllide A dehydrogenase
MDVLVCSNPGQLAIEHRAAPRPAPGEVLVRPRCIGICGTDFHIYEGKHPFLQYPRVMGHELAVEVVEAAEGADVPVGAVYVVNPYLSCGHCITCRAGKRNCCVNIAVLGVHRDGGMAELLALPASNLVEAAGLSVEQCATVEFLAIGAHAVRRAELSQKDRALVIGAGPIGLGVAIFASLSHAHLAILDVDPGRLETARALIPGVVTILADADVSQTVSNLTSGEGYPAVFDATGNGVSMEKGFDYVSPGGRYVLVSVVKDRIGFHDPDFHRKELTLLGSRNATSVDFQTVIDAIRTGRVDSGRLITHRTTLGGAIRDIPVWASDKRGLIKALITIDA